MNLKKFTIFISIIILFIYFLINLWQTSNQYYYHTDEHEFVRRVGLYFPLLTKGDLFNNKWQNFLAYDIPQLPEYFYGIALYLQGFTYNMQEKLVKFDISYSTNIIKDFTWLNECGENRCPKKTQDLKNKLIPVIKARKAAVIISLGTLILIFLLGVKLIDWIFGLFCVIFLWANSLFQSLATSAMAEAPLLFFFIATLLTIIISHDYYYQNKQKLGLLWLVLGSISAGLSAACKLTGIFSWFYIAFFIFFLISHFAHSKKKLKFKYYLFLLTLLPWLVYTICNPFTWRNPVKNFISVLRIQLQATYEQQLDEFSDDALFKLADRYSYFARKNLSINNGLGTLKNKTVPFDLLLIVLGTLSLIKKIYQNWKKGKVFGKELLIIIWTLIFLFTLALYIPIAWERYCFPMLPSLTVLEVYGIIYLKNIK